MKFCQAVVLIVIIGYKVTGGSPVGYAEDLGEIIFGSVVFRHGDRNIVQSYPTDPYQDEATWWPRGFGQLTQPGEEREHELGSYLRKRWANLLPETYSVNDIYVRSSDVDRALVSAHCNLLGLYSATQETLSQSNVQTQVIPIHSVPLMQDKLILPVYSCSKYHALISLVQQSPEYKCIHEIMEPIGEKIRGYAGLSEGASYSSLHDTLFVESDNSLPLPEWTSAFYPEPLRSLYLLDMFITYAANRDLQRLSGGPLIKEILSNIQSKVSGTLSPNRKVFYYSAHDATVVDLLQALGVFNDILVPYTGACIIELRTKNGENYVTVSYRNETGNDAYLLELPGCDALCPLETFVELTKDVIPDDIEAECSETVPTDYQTSFPIPAANVPPEWDACFTDTYLSTSDTKYRFLSVSSSKK